MADPPDGIFYLLKCHSQQGQITATIYLSIGERLLIDLSVTDLSAETILLVGGGLPEQDKDITLKH